MVAVHRSSIIIGVLGMVLWLFGIVLLFAFPYIFDAVLYHELPLKNNSMVYNLWKDIPLPLYQKVYFFNVDNPNGFLKGEELKLTQKGPYVYKSKWYKKDINFNQNDTLSYREVKVFHFERNMSSGPDTDMITTINVPLLVAAEVLRKSPALVKLFASIFFGFAKETVFIRRSVRQLTFEGYKDLLMEFAPLFDRKIPNMNGRFGYLYLKNDTDDGLFNVYTGKSSLAKFNVIDRLDGKRKLNIWNKPTCNMINGTNGELNPPLKYTPGKLYFFQPWICRSWSLEYQKQVEHFGLNSKRFIVDQTVFANASVEPGNSCYYPQRPFPHGVTGVAPCQFGAPVYLSSPHFYLADPSYLDNIQGLHPDPDLHEFYMDVEPYTGVAVGISAKFQVNLYLSRVPGVKQLAKVPEIMLPVFWQDLGVTYTEQYAHLLQSQVYQPIQVCTVGSYVFISVGGAMVLITLLLLTCSRLQASKAVNGKAPDDLLIDPSKAPSAPEGIVNPGATLDDHIVS